MGEERQRYVPDPSRRRGRKLSTHHGRPRDPGAAHLEDPLPVGGLQRHRPWLLHPEEQGRGARQRAVDRFNSTNAQGAFRYLIAAVRIPAATALCRWGIRPLRPLWTLRPE